MTGAWNHADLGRIAAAREIEVAPARRDGTPYRRRTIWVVRVDDDLYVRSYRGPAGSWFRAASRTHRGWVRAGQVERAVTFAGAHDVDRSVVDAAYRAKYGRSSYADAMTTVAAVDTTLRLVPR